MTIAQTKAARRKILQRYKSARSRTVGEVIAGERARAEAATTKRKKRNPQS